MRCVTSQIRNLIFAVALCCGAPLQAQDGVSLTLPQARELAVLAVNDGNSALAIRMARGLLKADPKDTLAHYILATAHTQTKRYGAGRRAAARAFRFARTDGDRLRSAQLAARLSYLEGRPTLAQLWLRRTANYTSDAASDARLARDYRALRAQNPLSFSIRTGLRRSSNLNNGSSGVYNVIDGVIAPDYPFATQALSGMVATLDGSVRYRLHATQTRQTVVSGRLFVQRVSLSDAAKATNPQARNSDYGATYGELSLNHAFAVGPPEKRGTASVGITLGESWYAKRRNFRLARLSADRNWRLSGTRQLQLNASVETRFDARNAVNDARVLGLGMFYGARQENGNQLGLDFAFRDTQAASDNGTYRTASMRASYALAKPVGPVKLSAAAGLEYARYPAFRLSGQIGPTRRSDQGYYGEFSAFFHTLDYAGFAPSLRLRFGRRTSNFSQYTSRELSLSLGIQSKF